MPFGWDHFWLLSPGETLSDLLARVSLTFSHPFFRPKESLEVSALVLTPQFILHKSPVGSGPVLLPFLSILPPVFTDSQNISFTDESNPSPCPLQDLLPPDPHTSSCGAWFFANLFYPG